jgi:hypothetical protein
MTNYSAPSPMPQQNSTTAILSLIAGIAGFTIFPFLGSIIAVVLAYMARGEIARSGGTLGGAGLATAGLVLGWIGIGLSVLGICLFGLIFLGVCTIPFLTIPFISVTPESSLILPLLLA